MSHLPESARRGAELSRVSNCGSRQRCRIDRLDSLGNSPTAAGTWAFRCRPGERSLSIRRPPEEEPVRGLELVRPDSVRGREFDLGRKRFELLFRKCQGTGN